MYSPLQFFPNTCIYVSLQTLIFVLSFLPLNPKILKSFLNTFTIKMKPDKSCILNAQQKEKKKGRKVKVKRKSQNCFLNPKSTEGRKVYYMYL